jgi:type II secretory pathway component PulF
MKQDADELMTELKRTNRLLQMLLYIVMAFVVGLVVLVGMELIVRP